MSRLKVYEKKIVEYANRSLKHDLLREILKDLLWAIIRFKEGRKIDAIKNLRESIDHSHKFLFKLLNPLLHNPYRLYRDEEKNWKYVEILKNDIFPYLNINGSSLLEDTRQYYRKGSHQEHEIQAVEIESAELEKALSRTIKLTILAEIIQNLLNSGEPFPLKECLSISDIIPIFSSFPHGEVINTFLDTILEENASIILEKNIITTEQIKVSLFLQNFFPQYIFEDLLIENQLNAPSIIPFRTDGPHLIDFEKGQWLFIPNEVSEIQDEFQSGNNILIEGISASGKTVLCRMIGFRMKNEGFQVYYIDCIKHSNEKVIKVLDRLIMDKQVGDPSRNCFIIENLHVANEALIGKLNLCSKDFKFLCSRRNDIPNKQNKGNERVDEAKLKEKGLFSAAWKIYVLDGIKFIQIVKNGILETNVRSKQLRSSLETLPIPNLWIAGLIIRFLKQHQDEDKFEIFRILSDNTQINREIMGYFKQIIENSSISDNSIEITSYLNHFTYIMGILSFFSRFEVWIEKEYLIELLNVESSTPLGQLQGKMGICKEKLEKVLDFLVKSYEISGKEFQEDWVYFGIEFMIPHAQMSKIYYNCILKLLEATHPGLIIQILSIYLLHGKKYGSTLSKIYISYRYELSMESYQKLIPKALETVAISEKSHAVQEQVLTNPIREFFTFINRFWNDTSFLKRFWKQLDDEIFLRDPRWSKKISEKGWDTGVWFEEVARYLGEMQCILFILEHENEIIANAKNLNTIQLLILIHRLDSLNMNQINPIKAKLKEFILINPLDFKQVKEFFKYHRDETVDTKELEQIIKEKLTKDVQNSFELEYISNLIGVYDDYLDIANTILVETLDETFCSNNAETARIWETIREKLSNIYLSFDVSTGSWSTITITNYIQSLIYSSPKLAKIFIINILGTLKSKIESEKLDYVGLFFDSLSNSIRSPNIRPKYTQRDEEYLEECENIIKKKIFPELSWIMNKIRGGKYEKINDAIFNIHEPIEIWFPEKVKIFDEMINEYAKTEFLNFFRILKENREKLEIQKRTALSFRIHSYIKSQVIKFLKAKLENANDLDTIGKILARFTDNDVSFIEHECIMNEKIDSTNEFSFHEYFDSPDFIRIFDNASKEEKLDFIRKFNTGEKSYLYIKYLKKFLEKVGLLGEFDPPKLGKYEALFEELSTAGKTRNYREICKITNKIALDCKHPPPINSNEEKDGNDVSLVFSTSGVYQAIIPPHKEMKKWIKDYLRQLDAKEAEFVVYEYGFLIGMNLLLILTHLLQETGNPAETFLVDAIGRYPLQDNDYSPEFLVKLPFLINLYGSDINGFDHDIKESLSQIINETSRSLNLVDYRLVYTSLFLNQRSENEADASSEESSTCDLVNSFDIEEIIKNSGVLQVAIALSSHNLSILMNIPGKFYIRFSKGNRPFYDRIELDRDQYHSISKFMTRASKGSWEDGKRYDSFDFNENYIFPIESRIEIFNMFLKDQDCYSKLKSSSIIGIKHILVLLYQMNEDEIIDTRKIIEFLGSKDFNISLKQSKPDDILDFFEYFLVYFPDDAFRSWVFNQDTILDKILKSANDDKPDIYDLFKMLLRLIRYKKEIFHELADFLAGVFEKYSSESILRLLRDIDLEILQLVVKQYKHHLKQKISSISRQRLESILYNRFAGRNQKKTDREILLEDILNEKRNERYFFE